MGQKWVEGAAGVVVGVVAAAAVMAFVVVAVEVRVFASFLGWKVAE